MKYFTRLRMREFGITSQDCEEIAQSTGKETPVMRVYGVVTKTEKGNSTYGEFTRFVGQFEAVNLITGEKGRSQKLILTAPAEMFLSGVVATAKKSDPDATAQFGLDCTVKPHTPPPGDDRGWKFKHGVTGLGDIKSLDDPISALGASFGELPLLIADKTEKASKGKKAK